MAASAGLMSDLLVSSSFSNLLTFNYGRITVISFGLSTELSICFNCPKTVSVRSDFYGFLLDFAIYATLIRDLLAST